MLHFHGIRFQKSVPERFSYSFEVTKPLKEAFTLLEQFPNEKVFSVVTNRIDSFYQKGARKAFNLQIISFWLRVKDILSFLLEVPPLFATKKRILAILLSSGTIEEKWKRFFKIAFRIFKTDPFFFDDAAFSDPNSEIMKILEMVRLCFLEQDSEIPPPHIQMRWKRRNFPQTETFISSLNEDAYLNWIPKNPFCRFNHLSGLLLKLTIYTRFSLLRKSFPENKMRRLERKEKIFLSYATDENQPLLIPESPQEALLKLQKEVQKDYSYQGIKFLFSILKLLAEKANREDSTVDFIYEDFFLLLKIKKPTKNQLSCLAGVLEKLQKLLVLCSWEEEGKTYKEEKSIFQKKSIVKREELFSSIEKIIVTFYLDPIFFPQDHFSFSFGYVLRFVPKEIFQENTRKHPLLLGLVAFFYGAWFYEFQEKQGEITCTLDKLIEGSALNVAPANRYRMVYKIKSELDSMENKGYIAKYFLHQNPEKNPKKDLYQIVAPEKLKRSFIDFYRQANIERKPVQGLLLA